MCSMDNRIRIIDGFVPINFDSLDKLVKDQFEVIRRFNNSQLVTLSPNFSNVLPIEACLFDRESAIEKAKAEITNTTLDLLNVYSQKLSLASKSLENCLRKRYTATGYSNVVTNFYSYLKKIFNQYNKQFDDLDSCLKSPYNWESIVTKLLISIEISPLANNIKQVELLLKLAQYELEMVNESDKVNEMQKVVLVIHLNKLMTLTEHLIHVSSPIESNGKRLSKELKHRNKKLTGIVEQCKRIIRDTFELMNLLISLQVNDVLIEDEPIHDIIVQKGLDASSDVLQYVDSIKNKWLDMVTHNATQSCCRSAALRRLNVYLKQVKKLSVIKESIELDWIIAAFKRILVSVYKLNDDFYYVQRTGYYLTYKWNPKPKVDVPEGFLRNDPIYPELAERSFNGLLIVIINIFCYVGSLQNLDWNWFQKRKPWEAIDHYECVFRVIEASLSCDFNDDEIYQISLDLADRYLLLAQKINYDRETLDYRLFLHKPKKPLKFPEIQKLLIPQAHKKYYTKKQENRAVYNTYYSTYIVRDILSNHFDDLINGFNRKITNNAQLIVICRAMGLMKRAIHFFKIIRHPYSSQDSYSYPTGLLAEQAVNEYMYAAEMAGQLLDSFRPNRRVPFGFTANGQFIKKINLHGLKVKDDFINEVDSEVAFLKKNIAAKETDLEPVKSEKTQLRYLTSISRRCKLIPIHELEITEQDEIEILKEIIEEYEYTMVNYGPVDRPR